MTDAPNPCFTTPNPILEGVELREAYARMPETMPGHWDTAEGREMAINYAAKDRASLMMGDMSDFAFANAQFMSDRHDLDHLAYQTAAKQRIRWLSAQLALSTVQDGSVREEGWRDIASEAPPEPPYLTYRPGMGVGLCVRDLDPGVPQSATHWRPLPAPPALPQSPAPISGDAS
jgi:hypothetical protein